MERKYYTGEQILDALSEVGIGAGDISEVMNCLGRMPSAELERKTGKWIVDDEYIDCSYCRREKWSRVPYEQLVSRFRFCPNCGAKMEVRGD